MSTAHAGAVPTPSRPREVGPRTRGGSRSDIIYLREELLRRLPPAEASSPKALKLSVLVPVYNERHIVESCLRRVLGLRHELIAELQLVVVDDGSTDGSREVLRRLAEEDPRMHLVLHETNRGKGAAVRTALAHATGEVCVIQDADLEYNPDDIPALLLPFVKEGADAVFGSRYLAAPYRRALRYRHTLMNRVITHLSNVMTDLSLSDVETCYKAIRTPLLRTIPLRSNDFRIEIELACKLARRRAHVFEVPVRYLPRTAEEGKKIGAWDGILALAAMLRFGLVEDIYGEDEYGKRILGDLNQARRFNLWMGGTLKPYVGDRVLEIGAGIGNLTNQFIPRDLYVASDIDPLYLDFLRSWSLGKPYMRIMDLDVTRREDFDGLESRFDTAIMVNVLEHVSDPVAALANLHAALEPGGRAVILVPQHPGLYGSLDEVLEHRERYTEARLREDFHAAGFRVDKLTDFNRFSVPGWWLNARLLRKKTFSHVQLKVLEVLMPVLRRIDRLLPWGGLSLVGIGVKE